MGYSVKLLTMDLKANLLHTCDPDFIHSHNNYETSTIYQILAGHMEMKNKHLVCRVIIAVTGLC